LAQPRALRRDSGFLLYTILDTLVDGYLPVAAAYEQRVGALEEALLHDHPDIDATLRALFAMRSEVLDLRRAAVPMRDLLSPIIRGDLHLFRADELAYYRDVYDHAVRVVEALDAARDDITNAQQIHIAVQANRQNDVNKQLTLIATIFLPLTFLTGFFGQNFGWMVDHIKGVDTFVVVGIGSELVGLVMLVMYFKAKHWF
jgi:magnesium transporter